MIVAADDVGTGAWSGPLCICGVFVHSIWTLDGLKDSKQLTPIKRHQLHDQIIAVPDLEYKLVFYDNNQIDSLGLWNCMRQAFQQIIDWAPDDLEIIIDGNMKFDDPRVKSVPKADSIYPAAMAASIVAKHTRDSKMIAYHEEYPQYNWKSNMGYITKDHKEAVKSFGLTPLHRKSFKVKL